MREACTPGGKGAGGAAQGSGRSEGAAAVVACREGGGHADTLPYSHAGGWAAAVAVVCGAVANAMVGCASAIAKVCCATAGAMVV